MSGADCKALVMPEDSLICEDYLCCLSGVVGCAGAGSLSGEPSQICVPCTHEDCGSDATVLLGKAEAVIAAGHTFLDEDGQPMKQAVALAAVRSFVMSCPPFMDCTGGREWDCSRWLTALLSSPAGRAAVGIEAPATVLELGAGTGDLAMALASNPDFAARLRRYRATDVEGRVEAMCLRFAERGLERVVSASALQWGTAVDEAFDLVLVCETLHWKGELDEAEDTIAPLADTLGSACRGRHTVALLAHRERDAHREATFYAMCRARGLKIDDAPSEAAKAFAPATAHDPGVRGRLVLRLLRDASGRE